MFKKNDYYIIAVACFFLGIFLVAQFYAGREYSRVIQPENNEVIALEVAKLTKTNADLRREVQDLTHSFDVYRSSTESNRDAYEKYQSDIKRLSIINGNLPASGQGVVISIQGKLDLPKIVDLINAIKNIGSEIISVNGVRITVNQNLDQFAGLNQYEIKVIGNSKLVKTAMERKGGIVDQIKNKDIVIKIVESNSLTVEVGTPLEFRYARIVTDK
ncbi:MAG: hypothetical protein BWY68_00355 [bacterium ADurb.Bin400]|nr:MAG: hypothetical protein BWY68_00355 [bacterium ADurb.Bin400]